MSKGLKNIFRNKKAAKRQGNRERRAMHFELLEKRILPSASVLMPHMNAVVAPLDPKLHSPIHAGTDAQAHLQAQAAATFAFKGADSAGAKGITSSASAASSSGATPAGGSKKAATTGAAGTSASSTQSQSSTGTQVVFVDPSVNDSSQLVNNLVQSAKQNGQSVTLINLNQSDSASELKQLSSVSSTGQNLVIVTLDDQLSGVDQITQTLARLQNVSAVDILSHGAAGLITVGTTQLSEADLTQFSSEIAQWKSSLAAGADIVLYGCDVAGSSAGIQFVQQMAALTGANVAAATQDVGSPAEGGTWTLGYSTGPITSSALLNSSVTSGYSYLLTDYTAAAGSNANLIGTTGNDRFIFDNGWGASTVTESGAGGTSVLDFSAVTSNLTFTINTNGTVSVTDGHGDTLAATSNIQELIGGSGVNTFVFESGASFSGTIVGGSGTNTLDYSSYGSSVTVNLATGKATGTQGVSNISKVVLKEGSTSETISDSGNHFDLSQLTANLTASINADGSISASDGSNTITAGSGITQILCNASETNTLDYTAYAGGVTVNLTADTATSTAGTLHFSNVSDFVLANDKTPETFTNSGDELSFSQINASLTMTVNTNGPVSTTDGTNTVIAGSGTTEIVGGSGVNTVKFENGASFAGTIDGGSGGSNILDYSAYTNAVSVDLSTGAVTGVTQGVSNFSKIALTDSGKQETVSDSAGTLSFASLKGNLTMIVNADGTVSTTDGNYTIVAGASTKAIIGGSGNNTLNFATNGATFAGTIDGGDGGTNTLNYSAYTTAVTVNLAAGLADNPPTNLGTATGVTRGVSDFSNVIGGSGGITLTGNPSSNAFTGNSGSDTFKFDDNWGSDTVSENASSGSDTLDFSAVTSALTVTFYATGTIKVTDSTGSDELIANANIEEIIGGTGNNTYVFANGATFAGKINGGSGGTNTLDYTAYVTGVTVNLATGSATGINAGATGSISKIQNVIGGAGASIFTAGSGTESFSGQGDGDTFNVASDDWGNVTISEPGSTAQTTATAVSGNELYVDQNDFTTGQTVVYTAGSGSSISGLTSGDTYYVNEIVDSSGNQTGWITLSNASGGAAITLAGITGSNNNLQMVQSLQAATALNNSGTQLYVGENSFSTGDEVVFRADTSVTNGGISGLTSGNSYFVTQEVDSSGNDTGWITLSPSSGGAAIPVGAITGLNNTFASLSDSSQIMQVNSMLTSSTQIFVGANGFSGGQAVVYNAGSGSSMGGLTSGSTYYVTQMLDSDGDQTGWITLSSTAGGEPISITSINGTSNTFVETTTTQIQQDSSPAVSSTTQIYVGTNSFSSGQAVVYSAGSGSSIGGLTSGDTYYVNEIVDVSGNDTGWITLSSSSGGAAITVGAITGTENTLALPSNTLNLSGNSGNLTVNISSTGTVTVTDSTNASYTISATNLQAIDGGMGNNDFVFAADANFDGTLNGSTGGSATNTLDYTAYTTDVTVNLANGTATGTNGISGINDVIGGAADNTVTAGSGTVTFTSYTGSGASSASNILYAGSGTDTLNGDAGTNVLYEGTGADTLNGQGTDSMVMNPAAVTDGVNATITESGSGAATLDYSLFNSTTYTNVNGITVNLDSSKGTLSATGISSSSTFGAIKEVIEGAGKNTITGGLNQTFSLPDNWGIGTTNITEDSSSTNDTLDFSAATGDLNVALGGGTVTNNSGTVTTTNGSIGVTEDTSGTTTESASLNLASSNKVGTIAGGQSDDTYTFSNDWGNYTINESSASKQDTFDFSAVSDNLTFNISATGTVVVDEYNTSNQLVSTATLTGTISNIIGGSGTNKFVFADQGGFAGYITGGTGPANILDYSAYKSSVSVDLADMGIQSSETVNGNLTTSTGVGSATGVMGISNITEIKAGTASQANNITGFEVEDGESSVYTTNAWDITGQNSGTIALSYSNNDSSNSYYTSGATLKQTVTFENFQYLSGTSDSNNNFTIESGGSVSGSISGRPYGPFSGTNTLTIDSTGSNIGSASYVATGSDTGTIKLGTNEVNYSGINSITDNTAASAKSFSYDTNDTATLTFAGTPEAGDVWTVNVNGTLPANTYSATVGANQSQIDVLTTLAANIQSQSGGNLIANVRGDQIILTNTQGSLTSMTWTGPSDSSEACEIDMPATASESLLTFSGTPVVGDKLTVKVNGTAYSATAASGQNLSYVLDALAATMQQNTSLGASVFGNQITITDASGLSSAVTWTAPADNSVKCIVGMPTLPSVMLSLTGNAGDLMLNSLNSSFSNLTFATPTSATSSATSLTINGGAGSDTFQVDQSAVVVMSPNDTAVTINGGGGGDQIICSVETTAATTSSQSVLCDSTNSKITFTANSDTTTINYTGIDSADNIVVNGGSGDTIGLTYSSGNNKYVVTDGSDTINLDTGIQSLEILGPSSGTGIHTININSDSSITNFTAALTVDGGTGSTVNLDGTATYTSFTTAADENVNFGNSTFYNYEYKGSYDKTNNIVLSTDSVTGALDISDSAGDPTTIFAAQLSHLMTITIDANSGVDNSSISVTGGVTLANTDLELNGGSLDSNKIGSSTVTVDNGGLTLQNGHSLIVQADTIDIQGAVSTSNSGGQAGSITLSGHTVDLEYGTSNLYTGSLAAKGKNSSDDGAITINAINQTALFTPFVSVQITNVSVDIEDGATINGGNVTITALADANKYVDDSSAGSFYGSNSSLADTLENDATSIGNTALSVLQGLISIEGAVSYAQASADINIAAGSSISSSGYFNATSTTVTDVSASALAQIMGGVTVGIENVNATIEVGGNVSAKYGATFASGSTNTMNVVANTSAVAGIAGAVSVGVLVSNTTTNVLDTAVITVSDGGINVLANTQDNTRIVSLSTAGNDGKLGIAAGVDFEDSTTNAYLDGTATAQTTNSTPASGSTTPNDINVEANMVQGVVPFKELFVLPSSSSGTYAQAGVGTNSQGDMLADIKSKLTSPATTRVKGVFTKLKTWVTGKQPDNSPSDINSKFDFGAAVGVAVDLDSATARIGDGNTTGASKGVVTTVGNINVLSNVTYSPYVMASSSVQNNPALPKGAENKSVFSGSVAVSVGYVENDAEAYINSGAQVNALDTLTVESEALNDFSLSYLINLYDSLTEANYNTDSGIVQVQPNQTVQVESGYQDGGVVGDWYTYTGSTPATINLGTTDYTTGDWSVTTPEQIAKNFATTLMPYLTGDFGVGEDIFNSESQATASGDKVAVAGAVTVLDVQNTSKATIMSGAEINQLSGYSTNPGSVVVQAQSDNESANLVGNINLPYIDITQAFEKKYDKLKEGLAPSAGVSGSNAVGASLLVTIGGDDTEAVIEDGAKVNASSLYVDGLTNVLGVELGASGGTATNVGVVGLFNVNFIGDTTLAQIQDGTTINVGSGKVTLNDGTSTNDSVVVQANDNTNLYSIAGGVEKSQSTAVGATAGLNIVERNTQAVIGDLPDGALPNAQSGSFLSGGSVWVVGDNDGYAVVASVSGSIASPPAAKSSGSNPGTGGTQGSDGSTAGNANLASWQSKWAAVLGQAKKNGSLTGNIAGETDSEGTSTSSSKGGVAISGSAGVNFMDDTADAWITNAPEIQITGADTNGVSLSLQAENNTNVINISGAGAYASSTGSGKSVGVAGAFALNILEGSTDASINGAKGLDLDGELEIDATRDGWVASVAAGLSVSTSNSGYAVAGSIGVNILTYTTTTELENTDGDIDTGSVSTTAISMDASDTSTLVAIAGSAALGGKAGVGVGIGFTYAATTTSSTVSSVGTTLSPFTYSTGEAMDVIANNNEVLVGVTGSVGIAGSGSGYGGAGTIGINYTGNTVSATVNDLKAGTTATPVGSLVLSATNSDSIESISGAVGIGNSGGFGAAIGVNLLFNDVTTNVSGSTIYASSFSSTANESGTLVTMAAGVGVSGDVAIAGSIAFNLMDSTVAATVVGSTIDAKTGDFTLDAEEDELTIAGSGGVAISSGDTAIGAAVSVNLDLNTVSAEIENQAAEDSSVTAELIDIEATSGETMVTVALGAAGSDSFALGGSVAMSLADGNITASVVGGSMLTATAADPDAANDQYAFMLDANDDTTVVTISGGFAGSSSSAVGLSLASTNVLNTTETLIDHSTITTTLGSISDKAGFVPTGKSQPSTLSESNLPVNLGSYNLSDAGGSGIYNLSVGGAASGDLAVGLAITENAVANHVEALVLDGSDLNSAASVTIGAYDSSAINTLAIGAGFSGSTAVGGAIAVNVIANTIESDIDDSTVSADTSFELDAETTAIVRAVCIGASGSGSVAVSVSALGNAVANTITAEITGGSTVTSGGSATINAIESAPSLVPLPASVKSEVDSVLTNTPVDLDADILAINISVAGSGSVAVAAAVTGNVIANKITADISDSTVLANVTHNVNGYSITDTAAAAEAAGTVTINAESEDKILAITSGVGASGAVGVSALLFGNVITSTIQSEITDNSKVYSSGLMSLYAYDDSTIRSVGLGVAASGSVSVGAIVAANVITNTVESEIAGSTVDSFSTSTTTDALDITALNNSTIYSFTGGVAASGVVGVEVFFAANVIANTTRAVVESYTPTNNSTLDSSVTTSGAIDISATDESAIYSLTFAVAAGGTVGVGVGVSANVIANTVDAGIIGGSTVDSDSTIGISATSEPVICGICLGVSGSGIVAVQVSAMGNVIADTTTAEIDDSTVSAEDGVAIDAEEGAPGTVGTSTTLTSQQSAMLSTDMPSSSSAPIGNILDSNILAIMVSVSGTGIVAVNGAFSGNVIADTVTATVSNSKVYAGETVANPSSYVDLTTSANSVISALTVGVAGSGIVAVNVTGFGDAIANKVESIVDNQSLIDTAGTFDSSALDNSQIGSLGIGVAGTGIVAVGATLGVNVIDDTIAAEVEGSTIDAGAVTLNAESESTILGFTTSIAGSGAAAVSLLFSANVVSDTIDALVTSGSTVDSSGAVSIKAEDVSTIDAIAFGIAGTGGGAGVAALGANVVTNSTKAEINDSTVSQSSSLTVSGTESAVIRSITAGISGSGGFAVSVTAVGNVIANDVTADIVGNSHVTSSGDILIQALDGAPGTIKSLETTAAQNTVLDSDTSSAPTSLGDLLNDANILSVVVGVAGSGGMAFNAVLVGNVIADDAEAEIVGSTVTSSSGDVELNGKCTSVIAALTVGVAGSGSLSISAAGLGNAIADTIDASILSGSTVHSHTGITQTATDSSTIDSFGLSCALAGSVSGNAIVAVNDIGNTLSADISDSTVGSAGAIQLSADSEATVNSFVGGIAASGVASVGLTLAENNIHNTVDASILDGSTVTSNGDIDLDAIDDSTIASLAASITAGGFGALGASVSANTVENSVQTAISDSSVTAGTTNSTGDIDLSALSTPELGSYAAGVVIGGVTPLGGLAGAGSTTINILADTVSATSTDSTLSAKGSISLNASDTPPSSDVLPTNSIISKVLSEIGSGQIVSSSTDANIVAFAGDIAASTGVAAGAAIVTNIVENQVLAEIVNSTVTAGSYIDVFAANEAQVAGVAAGFSASLSASLNASVVTDLMESSTVAAIGGASTISSGGTIDVKASDTDDVAALTFSLSATLGVGLGGSIVTNDYDDTTSAYVDGTDSSHLANIEQAGQVTVEAYDTVNMSGDATGVDVGGVAVGASMTTTLVDGSLSAYVGDDAKIGENSGMTVGALTVEASFTGDDVSSVYGLAGGIGALSANIATTLVDTQVDAYIGNADVSVSGDVNVLASAAPEAVADAYGVAVGGLAVGASIATAMASPDIDAYAGGDSSTITANNLSITASRVVPNGGYSADANATGSVGGLIGVNATVSTASSDGTVQAYVASGTRLTVINNIDVNAQGGGNQQSVANSDTVGLVAVGGNVSTANNNVSTLSYFGAGVNVTEGTVVGGLTAGTVYYVVLDDLATFDTETGVGGNEITLASNPGIESGDVVTFLQNPQGIGSGANICGLNTGTSYKAEVDSKDPNKISLYAWNSATKAYSTTPVTLTASGTSGTGYFQLQAQNVQKVYLASSYANAAGSNSTPITIPISSIVGGLNSLTPYEVPGATTISFDPSLDVSSNAITVGTNSGLYDGEAVIYKSAAPPAVAITANSTDTSFAKSYSGAGGVVAGEAASADVNSNAITRAYLADGSSASPSGTLNVSSLTINAEHTENFDTLVNTEQASALGFSGAWTINQINSTTEAVIGSYTTINTQNLDVTATNNINKDLVGTGNENVDAGAGGVIEGNSSESETFISNYTHALINNYVTIDETGSVSDPGDFVLLAENNIVATDSVLLDTGGVIDGSGVDDWIKADTNQAYAALGNDDTIATVGDVDLETYDSGVISVAPEVHTYGLAAAASIDGEADMHTQDEVNVGNNTNIMAQGNLNFYAGQTAGGLTNNFVITSFADDLNASAVPIDELTSHGETVQSESINIGTGSTLLSSKDVNLVTQLQGTSDITAYGVGKNWLTEAASGINSALGGNSIPETMQGGDSTQTVSGSVSIGSGSIVEAGVNNNLSLDVSYDSNNNIVVKGNIEG